MGMLGSHKKKNPETGATQQGAGQQQAMIPRDVPPLRSFVIRKQDLSWNENAGVWVTTTEDSDFIDKPRVVSAHGLSIDEERMISFVVFFFLDPDHKTQPAQATKLVVNADDWSEVEEINPLFPTLKGN